MFVGVAAAVGTQERAGSVFTSAVIQGSLHVLAVDRNGRPVTDLSAAELHLSTPEGQAVPIDLFLPPAEASLDLALLLDRSLSMSAKPLVAAEQVSAFLDALAATDCVFLLPFSGSVGPGIWAHPADPGLRQRLLERQPGGDTALFAALVQAQARMAAPNLPSPGHGSMPRLFPFDPLYAAMATATASNTRSDGCPKAPTGARSRRAIALVTDGRDTASRSTLMDVLLGGASSNVPILMIGIVPVTNADLFDLGRQAEAARRPTFAQRRRWRESATVRELEIMLDQIATSSGGALLMARPDETYATLLEALRGYYVLGYRPPVTDAGVEVSVSRRGVELVAQPGYYAEKLATEPAAAADVIAGFAALRSGQQESALEYFERALRTDADFAPAQYGRWVVLAESGRSEEASIVRAHVLELAPWLFETVPPTGSADRLYVALEQPDATFLDDRIVARSVLAAVGSLLAQTAGYGLTTDFGLAAFSLLVHTAPSDSSRTAVKVTVELYAPNRGRVTSRSFVIERAVGREELDAMVSRLLPELLGDRG